ncbi:MAG: DUF2269 domain-containing protein [Sphingomonadaceae bacterium]|nr:DUF2269 domain-containing protein [Sphingomonadaceae bacterium]
MTTTYLLLKLAHILSGAVLFGTGAGIAFFMLSAHRTRDPAAIAAIARIVVVADFIFTASAVVIQPATGVALALHLGWSLDAPWLLATYALYALTGACWIPVVFIQIRMARLAREAASADMPLPPAYHRLYRLWFALGIPAFLAVLAIYAIMIARPTFG